MAQIEEKERFPPPHRTHLQDSDLSARIALSVWLNVVKQICFFPLICFRYLVSSLSIIRPYRPYTHLLSHCSLDCDQCLLSLGILVWLFLPSALCFWFFSLRVIKRVVGIQPHWILSKLLSFFSPHTFLFFFYPFFYNLPLHSVFLGGHWVRSALNTSRTWKVIEWRFWWTEKNVSSFTVFGGQTFRDPNHCLWEFYFPCFSPKSRLFCPPVIR